MPAPGIIGRIAAQSMMGANSEEIAKDVEDMPHVKGGRYHEPPRDLKKKKKAKRRQQKQARRKNK